MKINLKKTWIVLGALLLMTPFVAAPIAVHAAPVDDACEGLRLADPTASCDKDSSEQQFGSIMRSVINILSVIVGAVSVVMIVIGGFRYVLSGGDSTGTKGAKDTIMYALIGLVVVLFAQVIVRFVLSKAS